jgi:predicted site-specific integrase-resolvase
MKLSDYAKAVGITYRTAWVHYKKGYLKGSYQLRSGTIIVPDSAIPKPIDNSQDNTHG